MGNWFEEFVHRNWAPNILNWLKKMEPFHTEGYKPEEPPRSLEKFIYSHWGDSIAKWLKKMEPPPLPSKAKRVMLPAKELPKRSEYQTEVVGTKLIVNCIGFQVEIDTARQTAKVTGTSVLLESRSAEASGSEKTQGIQTDFCEIRKIKHDPRQDDQPFRWVYEVTPEGRKFDFGSCSVTINRRTKQVIARGMYVEGTVGGKRMKWGYAQGPKHLAHLQTYVDPIPEKQLLTPAPTDAKETKH